MNPSVLSASAKVTKGPRACATCAKAKSRCIAGPVAGGKCERCHRLDKACSSQTPAPPRKRKEPKPTRVAELERRLEDLTARIEQSQTKPAPSSQVLTPEAEKDASSVQAPTVPPPRPRHADPEIRSFRPTEPNGHWHAITGGRDPEPWQDGYSDPVGSIPSGVSHIRSTPAAPAEPRRQPSPAETARSWPEGEEADKLLGEYVEHMGHLFPFAIVPANITSVQLRAQKPFFWKAIMMTVCHLDGQRQIRLGNDLLRDVCEAAIIRPQKTLDLLQGLQILISWYHYNLNSFQTINLLFLARSICVSLGFNESQKAPRQAEHSSATLEQMRAFAGTYYLVTVTFTTNRKPDALMNTSYLEACCRALENRMEYPTDEHLVYLVRAQQLAQSISLTLAMRKFNAQAADLPVSIVIKSFRQQIESFENSLPPHLQAEPSLTGHRYVARILLYEIGLQENLGLPIPEQLEYLWCCAHAVKAFLDERLSYPVEEHPRFICMSSFDFIYAFLTCLRLITFSAPGWDLSVVRNEMAFYKLIDRQIADMETLAYRRSRRRQQQHEHHHGLSDPTAEDEASESEDPFLKLANKLKCLRELMQEELEGVYTASLARAANTSDLMTLRATEDLVQTLESDLWQDTINAFDWNPFDNMSFSAQLAGDRVFPG